MDKNTDAYTKIKELYEEKMQDLYNEIAEAMGGFELGPDMEAAEGCFLHDLTEVIGRAQTIELDVAKFMDKVTNNVKCHYELHVDDNVHDVKVFPVDAWPDLHCEMCDGHQGWVATVLIGTSDSREPKFCFPHYRQINTNATFRRRLSSL